MLRQRKRPIGSIIETKECLVCKLPFSSPVWRKSKACSYKCSNNLPKSRMLGKIVSNLTKNKMSKAHSGMKKPWASLKGELNPNWIEDRSKLKKQNRRNDTSYKEWRKHVWLRDSFQCRMINDDCLGRLEAHHILDWSNFPELRYEVNNGITLCHAHHPRGRKNEAKLSPYFKDLVAEM